MDTDVVITRDSTVLIPEAVSTPQDAPAGRVTLRAAAAAVIIAWEAAQQLDAPLPSLRAILAGRPARARQAAGTPRKPREGTKQEAVLALLRRPEGATVAQVVEATGWAPHTVRGFFAGLRTRHGIEVTVLERVRQVGSNKIGARAATASTRSRRCRLDADRSVASSTAEHDEIEPRRTQPHEVGRWPRRLCA
jgi:hypothetical protein